MKPIQKPSKEAILKNVLQSFEIEGIEINAVQAKAIAQKVSARLQK